MLPISSCQSRAQMAAKTDHKNAELCVFNVFFQINLITNSLFKLLPRSSEKKKKTR